MMAGGVELISNDASASRAIWGGCTVPSLAYPVLESSSTLGPRHRGEQEGSLLPFQLLRQGTYIYIHNSRLRLSVDALRVVCFLSSKAVMNSTCVVHIARAAEICDVVVSGFIQGVK